MSFFAELKRRNVIRMAGLYLVGAWLIAQIVETLLPVFGTPAWVLKTLIFLLALGFVPALVFSWVYELTPEGLKRDNEVSAERSIAAQTGRRMDRLIVIGLITVVALVAADRYWPRVGESQLHGGSASETPSVAVLPFANTSGKPDEEYFSDGMTEELLNVLARLPNLKVAARTSVFEFKGKGGDVREIGHKLGVTHIVEGSVRRDGEQVRVTAQLVRVADGFHVWSDSYDRELEGVFALQDDIARQIAEQLQSQLGVAEMPAPRAAIDPRAYDEYLKGRTLYRQRKDLPRAIAHLQQAVKGAPEFAAGWATLALAYDVVPWYTSADQRSALGNQLTNMRVGAERAAALDSGAALTLHAQANLARAEARYADAEGLYLRAQQVDPTYADVREDYSELLHQVGRTDDALIAIREMLQLDPFVAIFWRRLSAFGVTQDRRDLVDEARERMRTIDPAYRAGVLADFMLEFSQGRIEPARAALAEAVQFGLAAGAEDAELFRWSLRELELDDATARKLVMARPFNVVYAAHRGDADLFFAAFEGEERIVLQQNIYFIIALPIAQPMLADPRAKEMLTRFGFVAYWREKGWPPLCRPLGSDDFECGPATTQE